MRCMVKASSIVVLGVCTLLSVGVRAGEKRAVSPEDLADIRYVGDVQISPDGKRVAFAVEEPPEPDKPKEQRNSDIWVVPADGSETARPFAASEKNETHPRWSPDGRYLAFLSNRAETSEEEDEEKKERNQIYLLRTDGGEAEQVTSTKGEVLDLEWSPDSKMIAFTVKDAWTEEKEKKREEGYDEIHADHDYKYARLWVLTLADRQAEQVTEQDFHVVEFSWSPDGNHLVLGVSPTPRRDDVYWRCSLVIVQRSTGEVVRTLSEKMGSFWDAASVRWSPDGQTIAFAEFTPNKIASWLALTPASGGEVRHLLKEYDGTLSAVEWAPDSRHLLAASVEGTKAKLLEVDTASGAIEELAELTPNFWGTFFTVSPDARTFAYLSSSPGTPPDVWTFTIGESPRCVTRLYPQVASLRLGNVEEITWKNKKDNQTLYGALITPPKFKRGKRYPTVVQVHGGPEGAWWSGWHGSWGEWGQLLASNGYVVLLPNPRGSGGQGWEFLEANRDDWGGMDFEDIMAGVDHIIEQGIADPDRLGIGGWSYGGFMTSWAVTQTDRFKAAIVGAGITNLFSMAGTTDIPGWFPIAFLDAPVRRREAYEKHSAMSFLESCKTPSLVLHGKEDKRVPVGQAWEFYNGLKSLGIEAELVVYPREPHGIHERAHQVDLLERVLAWYDEHLKRTNK